MLADKKKPFLAAAAASRSASAWASAAALAASSSSWILLAFCADEECDQKWILALVSKDNACANHARALGSAPLRVVPALTPPIREHADSLSPSVGRTSALLVYNDCVQAQWQDSKIGIHVCELILKGRITYLGFNRILPLLFFILLQLHTTGRSMAKQPTIYLFIYLYRVARDVAAAPTLSCRCLARASSLRPLFDLRRQVRIRIIARRSQTDRQTDRQICRQTDR